MHGENWWDWATKLCWRQATTNIHIHVGESVELILLSHMKCGGEYYIRPPEDDLTIVLSEIERCNHPATVVKIKNGVRITGIRAGEMSFRCFITESNTVETFLDIFVSRDDVDDDNE